MSRLPVLALLPLVLLTLSACEGRGERATFEEAFFLYRDCLSEGMPREELEEELESVGWSHTEMTETLEWIRDNDPERYRALYDRYRAHRGLPREKDD